MSQPLSSAEVRRVANLARLKLTDAELDAVTAQLGRILEYVHVLDELDTADVAPRAHAVEMTNVFREDDVRESLTRPEALQNAPRTDGRFFLVPQIIEH